MRLDEGSGAIRGGSHICGHMSISSLVSRCGACPKALQPLQRERELAWKERGWRYRLLWALIPCGMQGTHSKSEQYPGLLKEPGW